jgi:site-specific recombinase XerD
MASLYAHKKYGYQIHYCLYFSDGNRKKKYRFYRTKTAAINAIKDIERMEELAIHGDINRQDLIYCIHKGYITKDEAHAILPGPKSPLVNITWDHLRDVYCSHVKTVCSPASRRTYPNKIDIAIRYFEDLKQPHEIDVQDIKAYIAYRRKTVAKATINKEITALRIVMDYLTEQNIISQNPARQVKRFTDTPTRIPRCLTPEELKVIIANLYSCQYCKGYFPDLIYSYLFTGLRRYELLGLRTCDVDMTHKMIRVIGKGDRERIIEIHPFLTETIFPSVVEKNGVNRGKYFFGGKDTHLMAEDALTRAFREYLRDIHIYNGNSSLHTLRHTFISYLVHSGAPLMEVQRIAGHTSLKTTLRYTHLVPSEKSSIKRLDYGDVKLRIN